MNSGKDLPQENSWGSTKSKIDLLQLHLSRCHSQRILRIHTKVSKDEGKNGSEKGSKNAKNGRKGIQTNRKNKGKAKEAGKTRKQSKEERRREGTM